MRSESRLYPARRCFFLAWPLLAFVKSFALPISSVVGFVDDVKTTLQMRKAMPGRNLCSQGTVRSAQCNSWELTLKMIHGLKAACKAGFLFLS